MIRALPVLLLLTACADFPEVGVSVAAAGAPPPLLTATELAAVTGTTPDLSNALAAEAAALRSRARLLRQR